MNTETLDKFYLEWSQFTSARNHREYALREALAMIQRAAQEGATVPSARINQIVNSALETYRKSGAGSL